MAERPRSLVRLDPSTTFITIEGAKTRSAKPRGQSRLHLNGRLPSHPACDLGTTVFPAIIFAAEEAL